MSEGITFRIQAIDLFSEVFDGLRGCMERVGEATQGMGEAAESVSQRVRAALGLQEKGFKDLATGVAGAAAAGIGFYNVLDSVEASNLRVAKAHDRVLDAQLAVQKAQENLNRALEKANGDTEAVATQMQQLEAAQRNLAIAEEVAKNAQEDQIKGMTSMVTQSIPMMVVGMSTLYTSMGPVGLAIAGITFAIQIFAKAWAENWFGIRDVLGPVIDSIIGSIQGMIKWLQDAIDWWSRLLGLKEKAAEETGQLAAEAQTAGAGLTGAAERYGVTYLGGGPGIPGLQAGGLITRGGLAWLHEGERVLPAGQAASVTVNLHVGQVSHPADEERLARRVAEEISFSLYRRTRTL